MNLIYILLGTLFIKTLHIKKIKFKYYKRSFSKLCDFLFEFICNIVQLINMILAFVFSIIKKINKNISQYKRVKYSINNNSKVINFEKYKSKKAK